MYTQLTKIENRAYVVTKSVSVEDYIYHTSFEKNAQA